MKHNQGEHISSKINNETLAVDYYTLSGYFFKKTAYFGRNK